MSATRASFLRAILEEPDDDVCRLVFADYLEEQGEAGLARFIRTQIELARVPEYDPLWLRCWHGERDLITGRAFDKLCPALPEGVTWQKQAFERGFPARIEVEKPETFVAQAQALFALAPIQSLKVKSEYRRAPLVLAVLYDSPHLARIRRLTFTFSNLPTTEIQRLQDSTHARNLTSLGFESIGIAQEALPALFRPPLIAQLTSLELESNVLRRSSLAGVLRAPAVRTACAGWSSGKPSGAIPPRLKSSRPRCSTVWRSLIFPASWAPRGPGR